MRDQLALFGEELISECNFCGWARKRICPECEANYAAFWRASSDWEYSETGYSHDFYDESEANQRRLDEARELLATDPPAAYASYLELANAGSMTAMFHLALCLEAGTGVDCNLDQALHWYGEGLDAGSWTSALEYARLLDRTGDREACDKLLQSGVNAGLATAAYRLARYQYNRSQMRRTAREIRPLLDRAIEKGHPGATFFLSELMTKGKLGLGNIFAGIRMGAAAIGNVAAETQEKPDNGSVPANA
ncbi:MAG: tetratricopeptide repeat protein [Novosphingobium sp.]